MASPSDPAAVPGKPFVMWFLMMIANDAALRCADDHALRRTCAGRAQRASALGGRRPIFAGAYLTVWEFFSALAALAQWLLVRSGAVSEIYLAFGNQRVCGGSPDRGPASIQATPLKRGLSAELPFSQCRF